MTTPSRGRPRILVLLSCGWAVRNYVRSGVLAELGRSADVVVMLPPGDAALDAELRQLGAEPLLLADTRLPARVSAVAFTLVQAENLRHGLLHPSFWRWQVAQQPSWKRPYLESLRMCAYLARPARIHAAGVALRRRWIERLPIVAAAGDVLDRTRPDLVFATNPYRLNQVAPVVAAASRRVPSATAIMSWDNLSYKGLPLAPFSRYFVWSDLMGQELCRGEEVGRDQVRVTGTPQFDFHLDPSLGWTREAFCARLGLDPGRGLVTYSAAAPATLPEEPELVEELWRAICRGEVCDHPQLLVRVHPHDTTARFERLRARCDGLVLSRPWPVRDDRWFAPRREDLALLTNTLRHSDVVVNLFSTMALDAMVVGRPVICPAYSPRPWTQAAVYLRHAADFGHGRALAATGAATIVRSHEALVGALNAALRAPQSGHSLRAAAVQRLCGVVDGRAGSRIAAALLALAEGNADIPAPVAGESMVV